MLEGVQEQRVEKPVFIAAFSRTGTTILHRTMSLDKERWRNFDVCDMLVPLPNPAPRWNVQARKDKVIEATALFNQVRAIYPGWLECLETMHGIRPPEADEDMIWYNMGIGHMYMDKLMRLYPQVRQEPGGISHLESKEVAKYRYAWLKLIMQIHQYIDQNQWEQQQQYNTTDLNPSHNLPWLMKDPNHSAYLTELLEEFPDARLIMTHRSPAQVIPSLAKLMVIFNSVDFAPNSPGSTSAEMGGETVKRMQHYANGLVTFTKQQQQQNDNSLYRFHKVRVGDKPSSGSSAEEEQHRRLDFYFRDLVQDIPGTIDTIYAHFLVGEAGPSPQAKQEFADYLEANRREKLGNQQRSLQDFSLTQQGVDKEFKEYNDLFLSQYETK